MLNFTFIVKFYFEMKSTSQIMQTKAMELSVSYVNKILGMKFDVNEIQNLLIKAGMESKIINKNRLNVFIPPYRTDILHEMDIAEDIAIAYGYENFIPEIPKIWTSGQEDKFQKFCNKLRNLMLGLNFQESMSLILTNRENLFKRMNIKSEYTGDVVETENALSTEHDVVRNYLLPSLMSFLETNKTKGYPQRIFEIG
ncbi:MAG: phenylalanine--tRNA ligase subunit beta, partial [Candidatus Altiarchaeales archaeon HGW-Altiarchaeales-2]